MRHTQPPEPRLTLVLGIQNVPKYTLAIEVPMVEYFVPPDPENGVPSERYFETVEIPGYFKPWRRDHGWLMEHGWNGLGPYFVPTKKDAATFLSEAALPGTPWYTHACEVDQLQALAGIL